jgi:hypothetical protein
MPRKGLFVPKLHEKNVRKLYYQSNRFAMPVSKLLNLIIATGLEQLEAVHDPDEWDVYVLVWPEEEQEEDPVCSDFAENTLTSAVAPGQICRIHEREHLASADIHEDRPVHHEHSNAHPPHAVCE